MNEQLNTDTRQDDAPILNLADIEPLIATLSSRDVLARERARRTLVELGPPVVKRLMAALRSPSHTVRWEAAKALSDIGSPEAGPALVEALDDERFDVRWLAALGLIMLQEDALIPLLEAIEHAPWDASAMRDGAHHVLRAQLGGPYGTILAPVVAALEGPSSRLSAPVAAFQALSALRERL